MAPRSKLFPATLLVILLACTGATWISSPGKGSHASGGGALAYVTGNSGSQGGGSYATATVSVTPSGSNRYMLIGVTSFGGVATTFPTSVVFNTSESATKIGDATFVNTAGRFSVWGLTNPSAVTANVVVTFANTESEYSVAVAIFSGVNQTTPIGTAATDFSVTSRSATSTAPASTTSDLVAAVVAYDGGQTLTNGGSITTRQDGVTAGFDGTRITTKPGAASTTTMDFTMTGTSDVESLGVALKP